ncbi:peptidase [Cellulomonas chitinilytica]|uniref:Peptidase n=1 Tax=Cellulomonas chitinilytica TaxID=398759 RepID=A0A919P666_9CELL|nr:alpha/beta hydrolase [Cellulomonas chitinilytica]GIG22084.1 peptidase [Cellulomonas chitinilytica]
MTRRHRHARSTLVALVALSLTVTVGATAANAAPKTDRTSPYEAARVDRVPAPDPQWFDCAAAFADGAQCGTVQLPLDYDEPGGATTEVALLKIPATDQAHKIGSLFVNPGGPGGSGVQIAAAASQFLSPALLERFDVVGVDPRGTNYSSNVRCFKDLGAQANALAGLNVPFPVGDAETGPYIASSKAFGVGCSTTGTPLSGSMSTAEVARDMDVLRRTVGDQKLTYLGFSYGTYLGNVYANLFPDRVRAVVIDGVLDPVAWAGTPATASIPQTERLKSGQGASKALTEILARCATAGPDYCVTAGLGDPATIYAEIVASLKEQPLVITDENGEPVFELTYAILTSFLLGDLYAPEGSTYVDLDLSTVYSLLHPATGDVAAARAGLLAKYQALQAPAARSDAFANLGFPYDNSPEAFQSVLCTDGKNPAKAESWVPAAARADADAPGFGPLWTWASAPCARSTWTVRDEDAYWGTYSHRTSAPVLVVGNYWDPATNYQGAVAASSLLPNSRLLSSDSWGHTAYGTSACVTDAVDSYLLTGTPPAKGALCTGDAQPFTEPLGAGARSRTAVPERSLPPVVPPLPGALPRS